MSDGTKIEWTDATWNPITGCSVTSPGCTNCYAMRLAGTRLAHLPSRAGLTHEVNGRHVWTGEVRLNEQWLFQPLRWRRPRRIFVCAHGDLFHDAVPNEWIDRVFAAMALAPQHRFQVLTKRAARMRRYCLDPRTPRRIAAAFLISIPPGYARDVLAALENRLAEAAPERAIWPLPNVWLGVSTEDQARADERIPDLLDTPAALRWISAEPLLGPINLDEWLICPNARDGLSMDPTTGAYECCRRCDYTGLIGGLDWIIVGGESGPGARDWAGFADAARDLRDQCVAAGVSFFMKQMPKKAPIPDDLMIRRCPPVRPDRCRRPRGAAGA